MALISSAPEAARAAALACYRVLDTPAEAGFDAAVLIAAQLCDAPTALVSLLDQDRQWFKARVGFEPQQTPLNQSVCSHTLTQDGVLVIPDLSTDPRTLDNPLVTDEPRLRFYAGVPLIAGEGIGVGALCVLDTEPRPDGLTPGQAAGLRALASQVAMMLEMRRVVVEAESDHRALRDSDHRSRSAQEAGRVGTFDVEVATDTVTVSEEFCRIFGLSSTASYPATALEALVLPEDRDVLSNEATRLRGAGPLDTQYRIRRPTDGRVRWISRRASYLRGVGGTVERMYGTVQDCTAERRVAGRVAALLELGDALRGATTTEAAVAAAGKVLGDVLDAARTGYATVDLRQELFHIERDWVAPGIDSLKGSHPTSAFPVTIARMRGGDILTVADVPGMAWLGEDRAAYTELGIRSLIDVPLLERGELVGMLFVHHASAREWSREELEFVRGVADRTYAAVAKLRAEAEQDVLNKELSHRLKNTLSMVQAMASQTLRGVADRAAINAFTQRLHALGAAHDALTQKSWITAPLDKVAASALRVAASLDRFDLSGPDVSLGPRSVLSLALLLHELATNAAKYGALSTETGRISLAWSLEGEDGTAELVIRWREAGGPPVSEPERKGFGSRLIGMGLVGTGGVVLRYVREGFTAEMRAPLAQVQKS